MSFGRKRACSPLSGSQCIVKNLAVPLSGTSVAVDFGEPYWQVECSVDLPVRSDLVREWSAFFKRREGQKHTFTMNRSFQAFPNDRDVGSDVGLDVAAVDRIASAVTLSGLETGYTATAGDMIGYFTARSGFYVGEVLTTVSAAGGIATLQVWPPPFDAHPTQANPRRIKALGEFRLVSGLGPAEAFNARRFRFTAEQVVRG